jgi:hypothetical protein
MIRLKSLSIKNFRGIREGKIDNLTDVNVLIGRNNSGKTTVMESAQLCGVDYGVSQDVLDRDLESYWAEVRNSNSADLKWYRQDKSNSFFIIGKVVDASKPGIERTLLCQSGAQPNVNADFSRAEQSAQIEESASEKLNKRQVFEFVRNRTVLRPRDTFDTKIEQEFWPRLLANRRDKALTATLNDVFGIKAESLQLLPGNQFVVLFDDYSVPLDSQGDGPRTSIRTLIVLAMMQDSLLMLEEPECHQHPGSMDRYALALCKLARTRHVQLIVSTHSAECARSFLKGAEIAGSDSAIFHLTLNDGHQDARRLDPEAVATLNETGIDIRFLDLYG